jgi:hypothetical protein
MEIRHYFILLVEYNPLLQDHLLVQGITKYITTILQ